MSSKQCLSPTCCLSPLTPVVSLPFPCRSAPPQRPPTKTCLTDLCAFFAALPLSNSVPAANQRPCGESLNGASGVGGAAQNGGDLSYPSGSDRVYSSPASCLANSIPPKRSGRGRPCACPCVPLNQRTSRMARLFACPASLPKPVTDSCHRRHNLPAKLFPTQIWYALSLQ